MTSFKRNIVLFCALLFTTVRSRCCPTWFYRTAASDQCKCGLHIKFLLECPQSPNNTAIKIIDGYCLTYDSDRNIEHFGQCR